MYIVVIAWGYVVLMMALTETSVVAGIMTFLMYGVLPLAIIVYLFGAPQRKRRRQMLQNSQNLRIPETETTHEAGSKEPNVSEKNQ